MLKLLVSFAITCCCYTTSFTQIVYSLQYSDSNSSIVQIRIRFQQPKSGPIRFVMPRSIPGAYSSVRYDAFLGNIIAHRQNGVHSVMTKDPSDAPIWHYREEEQIREISYIVKIRLMEERLAPADASITRSGFIGLLNYSVFGWVDGMEKDSVVLRVETLNHWPIFTTLSPSTQLKKGTVHLPVKDYYTLADAQIFAGPRFQVKEFAGLVPFFVASYADQGQEFLDDYGKQGQMSLQILKDYFGELPFAHYSLMLRKSMTPDSAAVGSFGMEHLQSSTFFGDTSDFRRAPMSEERVRQTMPTYLHHIGHSFIPLRCYGDAYRPYVQEMPAAIRNIWFNEGFMWYIPYKELKSTRLMDRFVAQTKGADPLIKKMSLEELSVAASFMYAQDFRLGMGVYSRGALMANDMNNYLQEKSGGSRSMKDVFRYLYAWSKKNQRPFTIEEFPELINKATGIDLSAIYRKWQGPIE